MLAYRLLRWLVSGLLRAFFRQVEVVGGEHVPAKGPAILAGNHPNSLIDPALVIATCGRIVYFAAKDVLFRSRVFRVVLKALGAVPVARREDHGGGGAASESRNEQAFDAMFDLLGNGGAIGIFPEGLSHDEAHLMRLKTGAARLALGAAARTGQPIPICPVGLTFINPKRFRSRVLVQYGAPIEIGAAEIALAAADPAQAAREVTRRLEQALRALTINAADWETVRILDGVRRLYQPPNISIEERVELSRRFNDRFAEVRDEAPVRELTGRVEQYLGSLDELGLSDRDLRRPLSAGQVMVRLVRHLGLLAFWLPLAVPALALSGPIVFLTSRLGGRLSPRRDVVATAKIFVGLGGIALVFAATSILVGLRGGWPLGLGVACGLLLSFSAMVSVLDRWVSVRRGLGSLAKLLRLGDEMARLRAERADLERDVVAMVERYRPTTLTPLFPRAGGAAG